MTQVYDQFDRAFGHIAAYAILKDGEPVARICLKFGASVVAYVHWFGLEMTRGQAGGGGYDRATAAIENAVREACIAVRTPSYPIDPAPGVFSAALQHDDGAGWIRHLDRAGFVVVNVIA